MTEQMWLMPEELHLDDEVSGLHISVRRGEFFTRWSINGRDFYFTPDGSLDGTGSGSCGVCPECHPPHLTVVGGTANARSGDHG